MNESVFVVVPIYNEERVIRSALQPLLEQGYSVVAVDDGSADKTWQIIRSLPIYSLRHAVNLGQGAALQTGMTFALEHGARFIVHFDADGQHSVDDIKTLLEPLRKGEADVVLGSRFLRKSDRDVVPRARRLLLKGGVVVNGLLTGVWLTDAHNGCRAMTRDSAKKIRLNENRFAHASEILIQIRRNRLRFVEMPTTIIYTDHSIAKGQSMWNAIKIVFDMILRRIFR
ncbi:MAG: glycosyltransferase family 2 protein [Candidatus Latescibacterota bacterium]|nr:MAG: glycosyltransferase family 2 protein [Candidatus Latescibacterota bacterium]